VPLEQLLSSQCSTLPLNSPISSVLALSSQADGTSSEISIEGSPLQILIANAPTTSPSATIRPLPKGEGRWTCSPEWMGWGTPWTPSAWKAS
jgi:hypothetical protein